MLSSLPVRRTTVVYSRYLSSMLACGAAGIAWVSTGALLAPLLDPGRTTPGMWTTLPGILTFFLMAGLLISLFLPLYFRFGMGLGLIAFVTMSFALYVLAGLPGGMFKPGAALEGLVSDMTRAVGPWLSLILILAIEGALLTLSARMAARWFKRRDL